MSDRFASALAALIAATLVAGQSSASDRLGQQARIDRVSSLAVSPNASDNDVFSAAHAVLPALTVAPKQDRVPRSADIPSTTVKVSLVPVDLVLSQIALQTGANFHSALIQAQASGKPEALMIDAGRVTLAALKLQLRDKKFSEYIEETESGLTFRIPLVIWKSAELALEKGETLGLDASQGAFLLNTGRLSVDNAAIMGVGPENKKQPAFRPFILSALSGSLNISQSKLSRLGFGDRPGMSGITLNVGGLYPVLGESTIRQTLFQDVGSVAVINGSKVNISGNRFRSSAGTAIIVSGGDDVVVKRNIIGVTAKGGHGIKVTDGANDVTLAENIISSSGSNGIFADRGVTNLEIKRNVLTGSHASGISLVSTACVEIQDNLLSSSGARGVSIRNSRSVSLSANLVTSNRGAGVAVTEQPSGQVTRLDDNDFIANRAGIYGTNAATLALARNEFSEQMPRLLEGEIAQDTARLLRASLGEEGNLTIEGSGRSAAVLASNFRPYSLEHCLGGELN